VKARTRASSANSGWVSSRVTWVRLNRNRTSSNVVRVSTAEVLIAPQRVAIPSAWGSTAVSSTCCAICSTTGCVRDR
jgi:glucose-6-phosphate dehydrogenase assembly protein OpcA